MKADGDFVDAVRRLRTPELAPTTGDVAAQLNMSSRQARRRMLGIPVLFEVPDNPAPRWHVRGELQGAEGRMHALIVEAGKLTQSMDPSALATFRSMLLDAMEGRR